MSRTDRLLNILRSNKGEITINPLARRGQSRIWRDCKKAQKLKLVTISRVSCDEVIVRLSLPVGIKRSTAALGSEVKQ